MHTIYTLGTGTRGREEFINLLKIYKIKLVVDVRRFPTSKWEHFKKENLQKFLKKEDIGYLYLGRELGGYRRGGYQEHLQSSLFKQGIDRLEEVASRIPTAVVCAEKLPWRCHRRFIGEELTKRGWQVIHIIDKKRVWEPTT